MFAKTIAIAAVTGFVAANQAPKVAIKEDAGFMAGAMKGFMLTSEHEMKDCKRPNIPDMVKQAETMLPMLDMMAKQMNEGKEPTWMVQLKSSEHTLALLAAMTLGEYNDTEFCRGEIMAFEGRKLAMILGAELVKQGSAFLF
jgi:hypothetical protein